MPFRRLRGYRHGSAPCPACLPDRARDRRARLLRHVRLGVRPVAALAQEALKIIRRELILWTEAPPCAETGGLGEK